jgi:hypothetical protein
MPYEHDDLGLRIIGYNTPIRFYDPTRTLRAEIFLQTDNTLNIGGISGGGGTGAEINIAALTDGHFLMVAVDPDLVNSRAVTAGTGIDIVDHGPGNTFIISVDTSDFVTEGPDMDLVWTGESVAIGRGGDTILLYDSGGLPVAEFAATDAGLTAALAAAGAGDVVELPDVTITGGPWTVSAGTLRGHSRFGSVLDGQVTISTDCHLERLSVIRSEDDVGALYCVALEEDARVEGCLLSMTNATGDAYGVYAQHDGDCYANDNIVFATGGGDGYGYYADGAEMWVSGGYVEASTAPVGVA